MANGSFSLRHQTVSKTVSDIYWHEKCGQRCSLTLSVDHQTNKLSHNYLLQDSRTLCRSFVCLILSVAYLCVLGDRRSITLSLRTQTERITSQKQTTDPQLSSTCVICILSLLSRGQTTGKVNRQKSRVQRYTCLKYYLQIEISI